MASLSPLPMVMLIVELGLWSVLSVGAEGASEDGVTVVDSSSSEAVVEGAFDEGSAVPFEVTSSLKVMPLSDAALEEATEFALSEETSEAVSLPQAAMQRKSDNDKRIKDNFFILKNPFKN